MSVEKHKSIPPKGFLEKPSECCICLETLSNDPPLICGHWIHSACRKQMTVDSCPICRRPLTPGIKPQGPLREWEYPAIPFPILGGVMMGMLYYPNLREGQNLIVLTSNGTRRLYRVSDRVLELYQIILRKYQEIGIECDVSINDIYCEHREQDLLERIRHRSSQQRKKYPKEQRLSRHPTLKKYVHKASKLVFHSHINRVVIGRYDEKDVFIPLDEVCREQAVLYGFKCVESSFGSEQKESSPPSQPRREIIPYQVLPGEGPNSENHRVAVQPVLTIEGNNYRIRGKITIRN